MTDDASRAAPMSYDAPFRGLKVIDLSQGLAAPYCGMLLAQHGAEVIKVEPVGGGDWSRILGTTHGEHSAFSISANLGKRSLALDLKPAEGQALLWRLIQGADVLIEGFRPGVMDRLGFGYAAVAAREPRLLYLSVSGFGHAGPLASRPAMDPVIQAYTGLVLDNVGEDGIPRRVPISVIDMTTGLYAFQALSAALYARRDEARGRHLRTSLLEAAAALQIVRLMACYLEDGRTPAVPAPSGVYRTADGWLQLQIVLERDWESLCGVLDLPALPADPRFATREARIAHRQALDAVLRPAFAAQSTAALTRRLAETRVLYQRLNSYLEFLAEPQVAATGLVAWLPQDGPARPVPVPNLPGAPPLAPDGPRARAPRPGEHSAAILREHGLAEAEIAALAARGVVAMPAAVAA